MNDVIRVLQARENNLKNVSISFPENKITCVSGVSGSGKSSLIHGVIAREYTRRLNILNGNPTEYELNVRPNFKRLQINGLITSLSQKSLRKSQTSNVATISNLNDDIREKFATYGEIYCKCGCKVEENTSYETLLKILKRHTNKNNYTLEYLICDKSEITPKAITLTEFFEEFKIAGKKRTFSKRQIAQLNRDERYTIFGISSDIAVIKDKNLNISNLAILTNETVILDFSKQIFCQECYSEYQIKNKSLFTKSSLSELNGSCRSCDGKGKRSSINFENLIIKKSKINSIFLNFPHNGTAYKYVYLQDSELSRFFKKNGVTENSLIDNLKKDVKLELFELIESKFLNHQSNQHVSKFIKDSICNECSGTGFNYKARSVFFKGKRIDEILEMTIGEYASFSNDAFSKKLSSIFDDLSISHLSLNRNSTTLSGGELQRLKIASCFSELNSAHTLLLDEPSINLSLPDIKRLMFVLRQLTEEGNTIILIDHSEYIIQNSDFNLDFGELAGPQGGQVVNRDWKRKFQNIAKTCGNSNLRYINYKNVSKNNIRSINISIPRSVITAVIGVSGSGKSSLVKALIKASSELNAFDSILSLDQDELYANSRSTVSTYIGIMDDIRKLFSQTEIAKKLNLTISHFSSNTTEGACSACNGKGIIDEIECSSCQGKKFNDISLCVELNGCNISTILNYSVSDLINLNLSTIINQACKIMVDLGIGHLSLDRPTPTLSGGECQRLKLAKFLLSENNFLENRKKNCLVVLDEPTRGLSVKDSAAILQTLKNFTQANNTVIIIEHNEFLISNSDYIIEVGPGAGEKGGKILYAGISSNYDLQSHRFKRSHTPISITSNPRIKCTEWVDDKYFDRIEYFSNNFSYRPVKNLVICKSKDEIFSKISEHTSKEFYFSPFVSEVYVNEVVSRSAYFSALEKSLQYGISTILIGNKVEELSKVVKRKELLPYKSIFLKTDDFNLAYYLSSGVISIFIGKKFLTFSTRLVDLDNSVVGAPIVSRNLFNRYYSKCNLCDGKGFLRTSNYLIENQNLPPSDLSFYRHELGGHVKKFFLHSIKTSIKKFSEEDIVDFNRPFNEFSKIEKEMFIDGIPNMKFLISGGRKNADSDHVKWHGLSNYLADLIPKLDDKNISSILSSFKRNVCWSCKGSGYRKELYYYVVNERPIYE